MRRKLVRLEAVVLVMALIFTAFLMPYFSASPIKLKTEKIVASDKITITPRVRDTTDYPQNAENKGILLDTPYVPEEEIENVLLTEQNDAGYNIDVGDRILKALPLYVGESVDQTVPGRGRKGNLDPSAGDEADWFYFSVCEGQTIEASVSSSEDYDVEIYDSSANPVGKTYTADETGNYYVKVYANEGAGAGDYTLSVTLKGQNDAGTGGDAGDSINDATHIEPGTYTGYMGYTDQEDWYSFTVNAGEGIFVDLKILEKSDYDIHLYDPSGKEVCYAKYYGDDHLEYPATISGEWKIKLDMFPGWDASKWPKNYFLYGSGAYELKLSIGGKAQAPPGPIPQPEIYPVAQTFKVSNDPNSNKDEYAYIAAVPAANYIKDSKRYVSPIVYVNDNSPTHWFGTVDDTTQYLLDDWNTYLARHGVTAKEYVLPSDPVKAAADVATKKWASSSTAVIAVDGSDFQDEIEKVIDKDATLNIKAEVTTAPKGSSKLKDIAGKQALPMFINSNWGSMTVYTHGSDSPAVGIITPKYQPGTEEDWPHPYDGPGDNTNIYFPITIPGIWIPYVGSNSGDWTLEVTKYSGDRYKIPVSTTQCSLKVTVTTSEPSYLEVFLVDPQGNIRKPSVPHWNGGPINPIHIWNAGHWEGIGFEKWRRWEPTYSTEHTVEVNYPMTGKWTAIVTPHFPYGEEQTSGSIDYHITAEIRKHSNKRVSAALSAANGVVIASLKHVPLLYVKEDEIPSETSNAISKLGITNFIFLNINKISSVSLPGSVTEYTKMKEVVDAIKEDPRSENFITITSLASGNGYFAPASMIAAYHGSPVLNIGEAADAYDLLDKATTWREYGGGWYHGCRAQGHLPKMSKPFNLMEIIQDLLRGEFPEPGFDMALRWYGGIYDKIHDWIASYGLDLPGKEAYLFVADRENDIRHPIIRVMTGNNSFAGQIPFDKPAMQTALICRDILYPAIIYANPGRDVTTSQLMNFPDPYNGWTTNDGKRYYVYSSRETKRSFSSHGRFYEGHCVWENLLERYNKGASICYYSGHGTGGSGISAQYKNVAESFPQAELTHEHLKDFNWWDSWRGYMYDDKQTKTPRWGGFTWYNAKEPNLYDIIHFKWVDQLFGNLHSIFDMWMSCTTGQQFGPDIYLEHGAALWYGNAGTGLCPQEDLLDDSWLHDLLVYGDSVGEAFSRYVWLHQRDYTTKDPTTLYGTSSMAVTNVQVIFGDPTMVLYSPEWTEPTPIVP